MYSLNILTRLPSACSRSHEVSYLGPKHQSKVRQTKKSTPPECRSWQVSFNFRSQHFQKEKEASVEAVHWARNRTSSNLNTFWCFTAPSKWFQQSHERKKYFHPRHISACLNSKACPDLIFPSFQHSLQDGQSQTSN